MLEENTWLELGRPKIKAFLKGHSKCTKILYLQVVIDIYYDHSLYSLEASATKIDII